MLDLQKVYNSGERGGIDVLHNLFWDTTLYITLQQQNA